LRKKTYLSCTALQYSYIIDIFSSSSQQEAAVKPKASRISLKNVPVSDYVKVFGQSIHKLQIPLGLVG